MIDRQDRPALRIAYTLREELTTIFDADRSKADGLQRIRFWRQRVERSGVTCFDRFLRLLDTWQTLIANFFTHHQVSGFVEGLNNKLKVLKRRCYGLRKETPAQANGPGSPSCCRAFPSLASLGSVVVGNDPGREYRALALVGRSADFWIL